MKMSGQLHAPFALLPHGKNADTNWAEGGVGSWASLDAVEKRKVCTLSVNRNEIPCSLYHVA
jgi:hypothetical protein